jgi:hypothetical protein
MADYSATSVQPIVQGLLTVSGTSAPNPGVPSFSGRGVSSVVRSAAGVYLFTLDAGLPGNAGEVEPIGSAYPLTSVPGAGNGASSTTNVPAPDTRTALTVRGSSTAFLAGSSQVEGMGITWLATGTAPSKDLAFTQFKLVFTQGLAGATVGVDPTDTIAAGVEIVIWKQQPTTIISTITGSVGP